MARIKGSLQKVRILQTKRAQQTLEKSKMFSLIVGKHAWQKPSQHQNHEHRPTTQQHPILQVFLQWRVDHGSVDCDSWCLAKASGLVVVLWDRGQQRTNHGHCRLTVSKSLNSMKEWTPRLYIDRTFQMAAKKATMLAKSLPSHRSCIMRLCRPLMIGGTLAA